MQAGTRGAHLESDALVVFSNFDLLDLCCSVDMSGDMMTAYLITHLS